MKVLYLRNLQNDQLIKYRTKYISFLSGLHIRSAQKKIYSEILLQDLCSHFYKHQPESPYKRDRTENTGIAVFLMGYNLLEDQEQLSIIKGTWSSVPLV